MTKNRNDKKWRAGRLAVLLALSGIGGAGLWAGTSMAQQTAPSVTAALRRGTPPAQAQAAASPETADTVPIIRGETRPVGVNVNVSDHDLLNASQNTNDWLLYGRTYDNQRFSPLTTIKASNVKGLTPVAIIQTGVANSFEDSPIEVNGVLFVATPDDHVQAYDATNGKELWQYTPELNFSDLCCGHQSRGVAVAYGKVFLATLDARLIALDAATG
ncbi:MAG TPA: PQQ-binding-like beta-propeller repeat protein, partial [Rhodopila sp.]|nr:PQQ-binding-like beta-propeller repeat protein [Rhodopila sp.]